MYGGGGGGGGGGDDDDDDDDADDDDDGGGGGGDADVDIDNIIHFIRSLLAYHDIKITLYMCVCV